MMAASSPKRHEKAEKGSEKAERAERGQGQVLAQIEDVIDSLSYGPATADRVSRRDLSCA